MMKYLGIYLLFINVVSVILCLADKVKAKVGRWRIPEKTLFAASIIGGASGMYITMLIIRHKTKHKRFMIGLPILILMQVVFLMYLLHLYLSLIHI